jgi:Primase C terminal 2 (PriCT-2)/Family of unknown function (DUF5906)/Bifunctional DNA primase/polymerase, N-terminal
MSEFKRQGNYLATLGDTLINNGYHIVPIQVGKKAPGFDGWQKSRSTKQQLKEWLDHGHKNSGVGIITKNTPAVDIDVLDDVVSKKMGQWVVKNIADAPVRIGKAPKRLYLFRCDEPFRKITSNTYVDEWDQKHKIEILGEGQQFVAYHIHPETKRPYDWPEFDGPVETPAVDLPLLTEEKARQLIEYFDEVAVEEGWKLAKKARMTMGVSSVADNPWVEDSDAIDISIDELRSRLLLVPGAEDYDTWLQVGMALFHQFDGEEVGKELWHEWAETADNYDADALDRRWDDFDVKGKKRAPITARYILRLAKEAVESTTAELTIKLRDAFIEATDISEWEKARQLTREAEIDGLSRSALASVAKERRDAITGTKTSLVEIKKAIAFAPKKAEKTPKWSSNWVYDTSDDRFFNTDNKIAASVQGFNAMYDRQALTKKDALESRTTPSSTASQLALNVFKIPVVAGRRYMPGRDAIFHEPDGVFANLYAEHEIPERPEKLLPRDKRNVERVKRHIQHLLPNVEEQRMLIDWLSWVVQNPGRHANYAILLQGVQGDGKTFFAEMLRSVMGVSNVTMLNAQILQDRFTDWCAGQCVACIEEVRLINDKNKYEVINRIKPYITNNVIEVHPKGGRIYNTKNTTNYLLFTNYRDALPLDDSDRRYLILFSRWQKRVDIKEFKKANPDYYTKLYETIDDSPAALRAWLLDHEQSEDFDPMGDAPATEARRQMILRSKPEFIQMLEEIIHENEYVDICDDLVSVSTLSEALLARGVNVPAPKAMAAMMERDGFEKLGRVNVGKGENVFMYARDVTMFSSITGGVLHVDSTKVKSFLKLRRNDVGL